MDLREQDKRFAARRDPMLSDLTERDIQPPTEKTDG